MYNKFESDHGDNTEWHKQKSLGDFDLLNRELDIAAS